MSGISKTFRFIKGKVIIVEIKRRIFNLLAILLQSKHLFCLHKKLFTTIKVQIHLVQDTVCGMRMYSHGVWYVQMVCWHLWDHTRFWIWRREVSHSWLHLSEHLKLLSFSPPRSLLLIHIFILLLVVPNNLPLIMLVIIEWWVLVNIENSWIVLQRLRCLQLW